MIIAYIDGGSRGNPGPSGIGVVLQATDSGMVIEISKFVGKATNNEAEYLALILALEMAADLGNDEISVFSDSELVVKQITGVYECKNANLKPLFKIAMSRFDNFKKHKITHVKREKNVDADRLANDAMDREARKPV